MALSRSILLSGLVLTASLTSSAAHAQGFLGQSVDVTQQFRGQGLPQVNQDFGTQTIAPLGTTFSNTPDNITVLITPTQMIFSELIPNQVQSYPALSFFSGYVATETGGYPATILSATLDPATTAVGFTPSAITFDATDIFVSESVNATSISDNQKIVVDYTTSGAAPVPEASTTASLGLLLALGLGGLVIARKRKSADTVN